MSPRETTRLLVYGVLFGTIGYLYGDHYMGFFPVFAGTVIGFVAGYLVGCVELIAIKLCELVKRSNKA